MFGGARGLSRAPRDVPSLSPGDDTAAALIALSARLLLQKSRSTSPTEVSFRLENRLAGAVRTAFLYDSPRGSAKRYIYRYKN